MGRRLGRRPHRVRRLMALESPRPAETAGPSGPSGHLPINGEVNKTGRRVGELVLGRGVRLGKGSACLSLGRGTQPAGSWATICCVPDAVITPNVVVVKIFRTIARELAI